MAADGQCIFGELIVCRRTGEHVDEVTLDTKPGGVSDGWELKIEEEDTELGTAGQ